MFSGKRIFAGQNTCTVHSLGKFRFLQNYCSIFALHMVYSTYLYCISFSNRLLSGNVRSGLPVGFEMMGNPGGLFNDFSTKEELNMWYSLIRALLERYIGRIMVGTPLSGH